MSITSSKSERREKDCGCKPEECVESTRNTQLAINTERKKYCDAVYAAAGDVIKWEKTYNGEKSLYEKKKCMFVHTEDNYRRFRNTQICLGTELVQSTDLIKENVKNYIDWGGRLATALKDIFKSVKEAKVKMDELKTAATKLDGTKNDNCMKSEWIALLGKDPVPCQPCTPGETTGTTGNYPDKYPEKCKNIDDTICEMVCMTCVLYQDVNSLFGAASDVIGIQIFSNIVTLDPLQKTLNEKAKSFDGLLLEVTKARESDLKKAQEALVKSVQETTKAASSLYTSRSVFEALSDTTKYFCCPKCGCVTGSENPCEQHLAECRECICRICGYVQETFCTDEGCGPTGNTAD